MCGCGCLPTEGDTTGLRMWWFLDRGGSLFSSVFSASRSLHTSSPLEVYGSDAGRCQCLSHMFPQLLGLLQVYTSGTYSGRKVAGGCLDPIPVVPTVVGELQEVVLILHQLYL